MEKFGTLKVLCFKTPTPAQLKCSLRKPFPAKPKFKPTEVYSLPLYLIKLVKPELQWFEPDLWTVTARDLGTEWAVKLSLGLWHCHAIMEKVLGQKGGLLGFGGPDWAMVPDRTW